MKKLLLSVIAISIITASFAHTDVFQKTKKRNLSRKLAIKNHPLNFQELSKLNSTSINQAQLRKESFWDEMSNTWSPNMAYRSTYANNRLVSEVNTSYDGLDTFSKYSYTYDANGRYSLVEFKMYNASTHQFENYGRYSVTYSANSSNVTLYELYNSATNTWGPTNKITINYDNRANQILYKYESYDAGLWITSMKESSFITYYGNTLKKIVEIDSSFVDTSGIMIPDFKSEKSYDANGRVLKITNSTYNNNVEQIEEIDSLHYDANGIPKTLVAYTPSMDLFAKIDDLTWGGKFNADIDLFDNEPDGYVYSDYISGTWELSFRNSTSYPDNNGSRIKLEEEYDINAFVPRNRYNLLFDSKKNQIELSDDSYNTSTNTWEIQNGSKNQYQYDSNNNIIENIFSDYRFMDSIYVNNYKQEFSDFISIVAGVNHSSTTLEVKLFPNPSENGNVNINLNLEKASNISISVMDINGRRVSSQELNLGSGLNTVQLSNLNKGLYFVEIVSDYGVSKTKLIVK